MKHLLEQLKRLVPIILLDKVDAINDNANIVTIKNISLSDPIFNNKDEINHIVFSNQGLIDAHVQSGILLLLNQNHLDERRYELGGISLFSSINEIVPGDQVRFETELKKSTDERVFFEARSYVDGTQCSEMVFDIRQSNSVTSGTSIHPTASVHPSVLLGQGVNIGPYCIVNEGSVIGDHTVLTAHVMIDKWTKIGQHNTFYFGAVVGSEPQDIKYKGEASSVEIGDHNQIREYVTINRATGKNEVTVIGSNNMLLTNTHVGHNCIIGNHVTIANVVHIGGHVEIEDNATIGGLTGIHQFVRVGKGAMIGGYSRLIQDVPPFMLCDGNPAYVRNLNVIGCRRSGMSRQVISDLKQLYKLLYRSNLNIKQALDEFSVEEESEHVKHLLSFLNNDTSRGVSKKAVVEAVNE